MHAARLLDPLLLRILVVETVVCSWCEEVANLYVLSGSTLGFSAREPHSTLYHYIGITIDRGIKCALRYI